MQTFVTNRYFPKRTLLVLRLLSTMFFQLSWRNNAATFFRILIPALGVSRGSLITETFNQYHPYVITSLLMNLPPNTCQNRKLSDEKKLDVFVLHVWVEFGGVNLFLTRTTAGLLCTHHHGVPMWNYGKICSLINFVWLWKYYSSANFRTWLHSLNVIG